VLFLCYVKSTEHIQAHLKEFVQDQRGFGGFTELLQFAVKVIRLVVLTLLVTTHCLCCCYVADLSAAITCLDFSPFIPDLFLVSILLLPVNCCVVFVGNLSEKISLRHLLL